VVWVNRSKVLRSCENHATLRTASIPDDAYVNTVGYILQLNGVKAIR
jgi:hypothetical protein